MTKSAARDSRYKIRVNSCTPRSRGDGMYPSGQPGARSACRVTSSVAAATTSRHWSRSCCPTGRSSPVPSTWWTRLGHRVMRALGRRRISERAEGELHGVLDLVASGADRRSSARAAFRRSGGRRPPRRASIHAERADAAVASQYFDQSSRDVASVGKRLGEPVRLTRTAVRDAPPILPGQHPLDQAGLTLRIRASDIGVADSRRSDAARHPARRRATRLWTGSTGRKSGRQLVSLDLPQEGRSSRFSMTW